MHDAWAIVLHYVGFCLDLVHFNDAVLSGIPQVLILKLQLYHNRIQVPYPCVFGLFDMSNHNLCSCNHGTLLEFVQQRACNLTWQIESVRVSLFADSNYAHKVHIMGSLHGDESF